MDPQGPAEPTPAAALPPLPQAKPLAPKVFGIFHLVYGIICLLMALFSIVMLMLTWAPLTQEAMGGLEGLPGFTWMKISALIKASIAILLIFAGIGLLGYKRYGRTLSIAYGFLGLLLGVADMIMTFTVIMPGMMGVPSIGSMGPIVDPGNPTAPSVGVANPGWAQADMMVKIMGLVVGLMRMIYPLVLVIFFLRPKSKAGLN